MFFPRRLVLKAVGDMRAQLMNVELRSVNDQICNRANRTQVFTRSVASDARTGSSLPNGCGRRVSLNRRSNAASSASR